MRKFKGGELAAQFPPQGCGPAPPPEVGVAGGAVHVDVDDLGGGVEGCCPGHNIIHPKCPRQVRRLLQLMVGDGELITFIIMIIAPITVPMFLWMKWVRSRSLLFIPIAFLASAACSQW